VKEFVQSGTSKLHLPEELRPGLGTLSLVLTNVGKWVFESSRASSEWTGIGVYNITTDYRNETRWNERFSAYISDLVAAGDPRCGSRYHRSQANHLRGSRIVGDGPISELPFHWKSGGCGSHTERWTARANRYKFRKVQTGHGNTRKKEKQSIRYL